MKEKDKISRKAFQEPGIQLLNRLLAMDVVKAEVAPLHVRQTIFERETDIVLLVETKDGKRFLLHLEFQSTNDTKMIFRMAVYDHMLYEEYRMDVFGIVIYIGKAKLSMKNNFIFFDNKYSCPIIDIRDIDPQVFISSNHPRQVIFGVLAGRDESSRTIIIQQILIKLRALTSGSDIELTECIIEMEYLALSRSKHIQELIKEEVAKMPITLPIYKSLYFKDAMKMATKAVKASRVEGRQEGRIEGKLEGKLEDASNLIKEGVAMDIIHRSTGISMAELKGIKSRLSI